MQSSLGPMSVGQRFIVTSCGVMFGFIDSTREDIYDYTTLCTNCIAKAHHASTPDRKTIP